MPQKKKFCVIGLGNFGFHVASSLYAQGHEVMAIDSDKEKVQTVKDLCSYAILGDAASKDFLDGQGMSEMDAVIIATGERSHLSTLITLYLKELNVPRILVKAINEDHGRILEKVGASEVIYPEKHMAQRIAHSLSSPNLLEFIPLAEDYSLSETAPPREFIGKTLVDLNLRQRFHVTVIAIKDVISDQFIVAPQPMHTIKDSDVLVLIGKTEDVKKALNS
ncbi:TrkA family potassium uptake protein [Desulfuromonas acetoxidans]|uniref:TrkA-N n=1 Tax=Desulfuromonas acetoxidans (strain DSM 684 / 11070) TaxID=281689 RepID=Q1K086_DESA6|nr:TrkA family potassium uptake protein [Desulfuromonas acetoxidans]EAT16055.1 TrkA-N [Desulfuromonas acetoxidans DSM 684]MBF0647138.1 TrkA family potassium uptake protein [Desulfuromonas acetoxidans]NVD26239.1 TrkA family potassium uptake protein [Desulfuromonas acetoxidans]NVE18086.1 TrkA family potassium uptake protein [Desulfuromonas acetoxidans]